MQTVKTNQPYPIAPTARVQVGRRVRAARLLAETSLRDTAIAAGLSYAHLSGVERGREPLTTTDARDLGRVLGVPSDWLRHGW